MSRLTELRDELFGVAQRARLVDRRTLAWTMCAGFAALLMIFGLVSQHSVPIVLAVPLLVLVLTRPAALGSSLRVDRGRISNGNGVLRLPLAPARTARSSETAAAAPAGETAAPPDEDLMPPGCDDLEAITLDAAGTDPTVHLMSRRRGLLGGLADVPLPQVRAWLPSSGAATVVRVVLGSLSADGLSEGDLSPAEDVTVRNWVATPVRPVPAPQPRRLARNPGSHRSRIAGSGMDPKDLRPLTPSDSLRDVDWRASARTVDGELLVRDRFAESQGSVRLVVDTSDDLAWDPILWFHPERRTLATPSVLSELRNAVMAIATVHSRAGDRVGLTTLNDTGVPIPAATGNRHLDRIKAYLATLGVTRHARPRKFVGTAPAPGSLVYVFSGLIEPLAYDKALQWHRSGHRVIVVDVAGPLDRLTWPRLRSMIAMPVAWLERIVFTANILRLSNSQAMSSRMLLALRRAHLRELRRAGLDVITWTTPDETALALLRFDRARQRTGRR